MGPTLRALAALVLVAGTAAAPSIAGKETGARLALPTYGGVMFQAPDRLFHSAI